MNSTKESAAPWKRDFLGHGYECMDLPLKPDDEGPVHATLVRYAPPEPHTAPNGILDFLASFTQRKRRTIPADPGGAAKVVLYLHGWADYFLQTELAEYLTASGFHFYAVDLRKFGRSLLPGQTPGYVSDLNTYDEDLAAALAAIERDVAARTDNNTPPTVHLLAHSLGGLIAALWADRNPGRLGTLVLNSPWLELQGSSLVRSIAMHLVEPFARTDPKRPFRFPEMPAYWESVSNEAHGEWILDPAWRPRASFPIRAGWTKAVLAGHAAVERKLAIDAPVLVLLSGRTRIQAEWTADLMRADAVIDVEETSRRALGLSRRTAVFRYPGALHDVFLSRRTVRQQAYRDVAVWLAAYPY
ncbi:alpha-beta hydrolase superfamily lysophospholipase [Paenarthrobacter nitroguajacolicus]|uniref:alpha/beta hydrolase n=1 Tax=Paenarthrobacter TaxID=1742992 RepID=UPI0028607508|nr:alpha/beta hydrolase [Paenarthrobacter nitroguajacolicus]MDR6987203.1 alpha-beta hydrolase superfamily lysophospholipase [Paenarthrobacter nitroguajacolicus]